MNDETRKTLEELQQKLAKKAKDESNIGIREQQLSHIDKIEQTLDRAEPTPY